MSDASISYVGPLSEDEYLDVVLHIQKAMAVEPFQPPLVDVVKLLSDWRTLTGEVERLRAALEFVADDDNDPWQGIARVALGRDKECR